MAHCSGVANFALAYAKLGIRMPSLMSALSERLQKKQVMDTLTAQGLTLMARSFSLLRIVDQVTVQGEG